MGRAKRAYDRKWYARRTQNQKAHKVVLQSERRAEIRRVVDEYKRQRPCACGEADIRCLEFHHTSTNKVETVANAVRNGWSLKRIMSEIQKCVLLCANCHRKLHAPPAGPLSIAG